jgi:uncharacterized protein (TIGR03435 family)
MAQARPSSPPSRTQMGLKLVPAKGPVEVLIVDQIDRPTEN